MVTGAQAAPAAFQSSQAAELEALAVVVALAEVVEAQSAQVSEALVVVETLADEVEAQSAQVEDELVVFLVEEEVLLQSSHEEVGSDFLLVVVVVDHSDHEEAEGVVLVEVVVVLLEAHGSQADSATVVAGIATATPARAAAAMNDFILSLVGFVGSRKSDCGQVLLLKKRVTEVVDATVRKKD